MYTIARAKNTIKHGIEAYLMKDENGNYLLNEVNCLPFYLEGAPGIGKTEIVSQIAKEMGLGYVSFSLVHHTRNSLLGLPVIKELENGDKFTTYTMSEIIAKVNESIDNGHKEGILLLDEFPCMSESIMPAMLAFLQTKNIGTHTMPRGWVLVLCGNPAKYNKSTHSFDAAVTDRIRKIEISYNNKDFLEYAKANNFAEEIINYLELYSEHMYRFNNTKGREELVTCRGWENLSHILNCYKRLGISVDESLIQQYVKSEMVASSFAEYYRQVSTGITENERNQIFDGKNTPKIADKYIHKNFETKWNITAYLMGHLKNKAKELESGLGIVVTTKVVMDKLLNEREEPFSLNEWDISEIFSIIRNEDDLDVLCRNANRLYDFEEKMDEKQAFEKLVLKWKAAMENYKGKAEAVTGCSGFDKPYAAITKWVEKYEQEIYKEQEKLSASIDNLFDFLKAIDSEETLAERFFIEISNDPVTLKNVCKANSEKYIEMCKKQYGIVS